MPHPFRDRGFTPETVLNAICQGDKFLTSSHARTHFTAVWIAQAIELIEEAGPLDDEQAMAQAFRKHDHNHE